jgi:hypothetical protein
MKAKRKRPASRCPLRISRRGLLGGAGALGAAGAAAEMGLLDLASSLPGATTQPARKPIVRAVFIRPRTSDPERRGERPIISWPGYQYDIKAGQAQHTEILTDAAAKLGVQLEVRHEPLDSVRAIDAYIEQLAKAPPDGLFITAMEMFRWNLVNHLVLKRGEVPAIVYSPMGSSFTDHLKVARKAPRTYVGATQDIHWPQFGLRMLQTLWRMRNARICIVRGSKTLDRKLDVIGTTLHYIPAGRFLDELKKVQAGEEVRALADSYARGARKIVEPKKQEILEAAKNYIVCRRLLAAEDCEGFSMDCLGLTERGAIQPLCMAFSHLLDEGTVAACEADWNAAISMLLTHLLFERPGFMQDPAPNTVNNTLMGAHCTSATRLDGFDQPARAPFILRSYHTRTGVALQVLWRVGQKVTVMKFTGPGTVLLGTGRVRANIPQPPAGCCRTAVEIELDGVADSGDTKGFHQLFIYGDLERPFKAYCQLAGIQVVHI